MFVRNSTITVTIYICCTTLVMFNHLNICILDLLFHLYDVSSHLYFLLNTSLKFAVYAEICNSCTTCLYVHHHHKHQGLDPLIHSVSRVTVALANASSVFQLFSFLVVCSGMISKGFGFVAFFASVKASSVCIHLTYLVCL